MTEKDGASMDRETFRALVETYGASPHRWPDEVREKADAFASTEEGRALAEAAGRVDAMLMRLEPPSPSAPLMGRILADGERRLSMRRRLHRWAISAGLIGVGVAGGLTGAVVMMTIAPPPSLSIPALSISGTVTAFGELQPDSEFLQEKP